jgi:hypothetical protein
LFADKAIYSTQNITKVRLYGNLFATMNGGVKRVELPYDIIKVVDRYNNNSYDVLVAAGGPPDLSAETTRLASIRRDLKHLCRSRGTRTSEFSPSRPCQWQPFHTLVPGTDDVFTGDGAWQFVADLLDAGHPLKEVLLKKPPGKRGYVMEVEVQGRRPLYIKLQLGSGQVWGRSFHDSIPHEEDV